MMPTGATRTQRVADLAAVLDEEIDLLAARRDQLARLTVAIPGGDERATERLLQQMERTQQAQAQTDNRLRAARNAMASALACDASQLRLSRLVDRLDGADRDRIERRRARIVALVEAVRREHIKAAMLLSECARINRELLESLFPASTPVTTYGAAGRESWRPHTGLVDTES
ncbi:MAG: flagellar export chaperone FlgN [Phycisphaerae bacterium]|nr:flagellar export chaperone FlgN [Phycisphaerae bacterium]